MNPDSASLDNLRDIAEPSAVSWWPLAVGWWILIGALLVAAAVCAVRAIHRWRANAYRRAALGELESAQSMAAISEILKRTALAAFSRSEVASMSGETWCQWLGSTSGIPVPSRMRQCLISGIYDDTDSDAVLNDKRQVELKDFASRWIRSHQVDVEHRTASGEK